MFEPTCPTLCCKGAGCLSGVRTYLLGTVLQGCRLFKRCQNLPDRHCVYRGAGCFSGVSTYLLGTVLQGCSLAVSEPTCRALCCWGAGCLSNVQTYLPGTVLQGAGCLSGVRTYLQGSVLQGCMLFKRSQNLPAENCVAGVQAV